MTEVNVENVREQRDFLLLASTKARLLLEMRDKPVVDGPSALSECQKQWPEVKTNEQALAKLNEYLMEYNVVKP